MYTVEFFDGMHQLQTLVFPEYDVARAYFDCIKPESHPVLEYTALEPAR